MIRPRSIDVDLCDAESAGSSSHRVLSLGNIKQSSVSLYLGGVSYFHLVRFVFSDDTRATEAVDEFFYYEETRPTVLSDDTVLDSTSSQVNILSCVTTSAFLSNANQRISFIFF